VNRTAFPDIHPSAWEHPGDRAALGTLQRLPLLGEMARFLGGLTSDRAMRLFFLGSSVKATALQYPRVYSLMNEACRILDVAEVPEVFVQPEHRLNAMALGLQKPMVVLNSSVVKHFDDDELLVILAHELAHIKSGHVLYLTIIWFLTRTAAMNLPIHPLALYGFLGVLLDWQRKAEVSCDRASLLVIQSPDIFRRTWMKMMGGGDLKNLDPVEIERQAKEYEGSGDLLDSVYRIMNLFPQTHPLLIQRIKEAELWVREGHYDRILRGDYAKSAGTEPQDEVKRAWKEWVKDVNRSDDPLARLGKIPLGEVDKGVEYLEGIWKNLFGQGGPDNNGT